MDSQGARFEGSNLRYNGRRVCTNMNLGVVSILLEKNKLLLTWPGLMTFAIGEMKRTQRGGPRTTPGRMVVMGDDESILTKDERENRYN